MNLSLRNAHAATLAKLDRLGPIDRLKQAHDLEREARDLHRAMRARTVKALKELLRTGATWDEIGARTNLPEKRLRKMLTPDYQATGEDAQGSSPASSG